MEFGGPPPIFIKLWKSLNEMERSSDDKSPLNGHIRKHSQTYELAKRYAVIKHDTQFSTSNTQDLKDIADNQPSTLLFVLISQSRCSNSDSRIRKSKKNKASNISLHFISVLRNQYG